VTPRFLADENFKTAIVVGLRRMVPGVDIVRVQDVGLRTTDDPVILEWAARDGRILLTHDIRTIPNFANRRVSSGLPMPGVFVAHVAVPVGVVVGDLTVIASASDAAEWTNQVAYLPLR